MRPFLPLLDAVANGNENDDLGQQSVTCSASLLVLLQQLWLHCLCPRTDTKVRTGPPVWPLYPSVSFHTPFPLFHLPFVFASLCKAYPSLPLSVLHHCPNLLFLSSVPHHSSFPLHLASSQSVSLSFLHLFGVFPGAVRGQKGP